MDDPIVIYHYYNAAKFLLFSHRQVLGKQFKQYLPLVMGPVLRTASLKPEVALLDNEDMQGVENDVDWQFVSLGEQQNFGIKTAGKKLTKNIKFFCLQRFW